LFVLGTLFPPLAVAARFGIGGDFWLNLLLTVCGYIPGHGHNFYIQNIRNNKTNRRTPKWAQRYGLVDTSDIKRKERKSQWASRYNDRLPNSTLEGQEYEEGQNVGGTPDGQAVQQRPSRGGELWREEDESYYGQNGNGDAGSSESGGRWHYPANFEDTIPEPEPSRKKKSKKDRWERTEDAYSVTDDGGKRKKKKKKSKVNRSTVGDAESFDRSSTNDFPEDAEGGLYDDRSRGGVPGGYGSTPANAGHGEQDELEHQF